jgi:hypothetical protein
MALDSEIVIVSGLPRSGTSLMMQMLARGGIPLLTDKIRTPDSDNPHGYFEFERVKKTKEYASWLPDARGKAVKMVSFLLDILPETEFFRVIFMERRLDEILESQEKMLRRLNRPVTPRERMKAAFTLHLDRSASWLPLQPHVALLNVSYNRLMNAPDVEIRRVAEFLDGVPRPERMLEAIYPSLYRNRKAAEFPSTETLPQ